MSREEAQSEMQKFKGEALVRDVEKQTKLLSQAKSRSLLIRGTMTIIFCLIGVVMWAMPYLLFKKDPMDFVILSMLFIGVTYTNFAAAMIHKRMDSLIELIGEENLLKKS